jgi:hypothetical protein
MPNRQVYIPDELLEVWERIPNKSALVQEATERWQALHVPNTKIILVCHFEDHFDCVIDELIINVPERASMAKVQQKYHPLRSREDYVIREINMVHGAVKQQIEKMNEITLINWDEIKK